jgi:membrane-bound ClpP family serine protease
VVSIPWTKDEFRCPSPSFSKGGEPRGWILDRKGVRVINNPNKSHSAIISMMTTRLIVAILSTLLEEAAIAVVVLWGLPRLGVEIPLAGLIAFMVAWAAFAVFTYRKGTKALKKKPVVGLSNMVGSQGKVVTPLDPEGLVRIKGELWKSKSADRRINTGEGVIVVGQDGLKLIVRRDKSG